MQYKTLLSLIKEGSSARKTGSAWVSIPEDLFRNLLVSALKSKNFFDEQFYLATNADIREAIKKKTIESAAEHYFQTGYFEGRVPKKILVDESYYIEKNPDVADAIRKGVIKSVQEHFEYAGFREGRAPYRDFSLF